MARTVVHDLEVIELKQLDAWMEQNWGVREPARLNTSEKLVSFSDFSQDDIDYCHSIVQEDLKYYQKVQKALERHGGSSIRGAQIVAGA
jgi:hypothetical protein